MKNLRLVPSELKKKIFRRTEFGIELKGYEILLNVTFCNKNSCVKYLIKNGILAEFKWSESVILCVI